MTLYEALSPKPKMSNLNTSYGLYFDIQPVQKSYFEQNNRNICHVKVVRQVVNMDFSAKF